MPAIYDFTTIIGNTLPIHLRLRRFDAAGSNFVFRCLPGRRPGTPLRKASTDGAIALTVAPDPDDAQSSMSELKLALSSAETRMLGEGRINPYELEYWQGSEQTTVLSGHIIATPGVNDDA